jgi:Skp family chaperone for outer membrane proteins
MNGGGAICSALEESRLQRRWTMRELLRVGVVLLIVGTLFLAGRSWSWSGPADTHPVAAPLAKPKSRVALINLTFVIKNYEKFKAFQEEMKAAVAPFQEKDKALKSEGEKLARKRQDEQDAERREKIEEQLDKLKRAIEDNKKAATRTLTRKQEEQVKALFKDVQEAVARYARAHDIELVLHYNDAITPADLDSAQNITRKMQAGACMPLYTAPGIDVSKEILAALNDELRRRKERF